MHAGTPFVMIASEEDRFLIFLEAHERIRPASAIGCVRVVILREVAAIRVAIDRAEVHVVLWSDLLLQLQRNFRALNVVVPVLAGIALVKRGERITKVAECAILRRRFGPCASAEIFRRRGETDSVTFEQFRVFLLRNGVRECSGADGREERRQQVLVHRRRLVTQVRCAQIAQTLVTVGQE